MAYKIWEKRSCKKGVCELSRMHTHHLERHHLSYDPEITIDISHDKHFLCHFYPNRLSKQDKLRLLSRKFGNVLALSLLAKYEYDVVELAKLIAPSRKREIQKAQLKEQEKLRASGACKV